LLKSKLYNF